MHKLLRASLASALLISAAVVEAHDAQVVKGFKNPESVAVAKDGLVYVSEIGEFEKDGDGKISVVGKDGKVKAFASGLNDPKGLAFIGDHLYVADKDRILKVGKDGKWSVFVDKSAFPAPPKFLNDLEPDLAGNLYVSDSGDIANQGGDSGAIYKIDTKGKLTTVINHQQDPRVKAPNGLLMDDTGDMLMFVDFASGVLYRLDIPNRHLIELAKGFGGADGIVLAANQHLYISDYVNGKVFSVSVDDVVKQEKQGFQSAADLGITADGKTLLVPDMKAGTVTWIHLH
ncbi:MAG: SMP-30/gluconolactonase/LRE family protein [Methylobacillus glycogenes]|nr:SMP-30/gluconolactonase/LRE family protein [Methylobacillus glycogenes]